MFCLALQNTVIDAIKRNEGSCHGFKLREIGILLLDTKRRAFVVLPVIIGGEGAVGDKPTARDRQVKNPIPTQFQFCPVLRHKFVKGAWMSEESAADIRQNISDRPSVIYEPVCRPYKGDSHVTSSLD